jgi:hypothetical protein
VIETTTFFVGDCAIKSEHATKETKSVNERKHQQKIAGFLEKGFRLHNGSGSIRNWFCF